MTAPDLGTGATTRYFKDALLSPALQEYDRSIAPRIKEAFAAGGGAFNSRQGVELSNALGTIQTQAQGQLAQALMQNQQLGAQLGLQAQQSNQQNAFNSRTAGIQLAGQAANQPLQAGALISSLLSPFQGRADAQAQSQYQEFIRQAPESSPWLKYALDFTGQSQLGVYQQPGTSIGGGLAGFGMGLNSGLFNALPGGPLLGGLVGGLLGLGK